MLRADMIFIFQDYKVNISVKKKYQTSYIGKQTQCTTLNKLNNYIPEKKQAQPSAT